MQLERKMLRRNETSNLQRIYLIELDQINFCLSNNKTKNTSVSQKKTSLVGIQRPHMRTSRNLRQN